MKPSLPAIKLLIKSRKFRQGLLLLISLVPLLKGMLWLTIGSLLLGTILSTFFSEWKWMQQIKSSFFISTIVSFLLLFVFTILIRLFIFEIYSIPSESMNDALFKGDNIIVSKLNYGPKLPRSPFEISWINLFFYQDNKNYEKTDIHWWKYKRGKGFTDVRREDMIVFISPENTQTFLIKRCMGLPGENLEIIEGQVFINKNAIRPIVTVIPYSKIFFNNYREDLERIKTKLFLKKKKTHSLSKYDSIVQDIRISNIFPAVYPQNALFKWSIDNYGSIYIPQKGAHIIMDNKNFILYEKIIKQYEKEDILAVNGHYYINNQLISSYTFKQNYYFVLGDNRNNSRDSRFIGFIPEEAIEGKATFVLFNKISGWRWDRFLKFI